VVLPTKNLGLDSVHYTIIGRIPFLIIDRHPLMVLPLRRISSYMNLQSAILGVGENATHLKTERISLQSELRIYARYI
jgi:hypothetical protein